MEELRIDCLHQTEEELGVVKELRQNIFRLNIVNYYTRFFRISERIVESNTIVVGNPAKLIRRI